MTAIVIKQILQSTDIRPHSLIGTGNVDKAAIFNSEGNSVWATSAGFTVRHLPPLLLLLQGLWEKEMQIPTDKDMTRHDSR
jgi:hypothetical protein